MTSRVQCGGNPNVRRSWETSAIYILDTCAIRSIPWAKLERAEQNGVDFAVCPITCFELASHLVKAEKQNYARSRSNFLKCRIPHLLEDSAVRWADRARTPHSVNPSRREERDLLLQTLHIASEAQSLDDLYAKDLRYQDGFTLPLANHGERLDGILRGEEQWYINHMTQLLREQEFFRLPNGSYCITRKILVGNLERAGRSESTNSWIGRRRAVSNAMVQAPYIGYMLHRLYDAKNDGRNDIDRNDYEDAIICLAIDLDRHDVLVTKDKGTIRALKHTTALLEREDCVMSTDEFVQRECQ